MWESRIWSEMFLLESLCNLENIWKGYKKTTLTFINWIKFREKHSCWFRSDLKEAELLALKGLYVFRGILWIFWYCRPFGTFRTMTMRNEARGVFHVGSFAVTMSRDQRNLGRIPSFDSEGGCTDRNGLQRRFHFDNHLQLRCIPPHLLQVGVLQGQPCPLVPRVSTWCNVLICRLVDICGFGLSVIQAPFLQQPPARVALGTTLPLVDVVLVEPLTKTPHLSWPRGGWS